MPDIEYVPIPVPKHLIPAVMALIAGQMGPVYRQEQNMQTASPPAQSGAITRELVARMFKESGSSMRKALKGLSKHPGRPVSSNDLSVEVFGAAKGRKLAGVMGAFGHRCSGRYGNVKPFSVVWNPMKSRWEYTMAAEVAAWIEALPFGS